jgi:hypothetical protein
MKRRRLFYDIETSVCEGVFYRPGYNQTIHPGQVLKHAQIICISWKWEGKSKIHNVHWGLDEQCDKKVLEKFIPELDKADEIVAHNGNRFDIKWIRARAAFHGIPMKPAYRMIDTYKMAKKYFALPSYRLGEVANYFGLEAKKDPGGLQTWIDIVIHKSKEALDTMLWYCDGDIATLEDVFKKLRTYAEHSLHYAAKQGEGKFRCPECAEMPYHNKMYTTAAGTIQHYMRCSDTKCGQFFKINNKTYQDWLQYKMINGIK